MIYRQTGLNTSKLTVVEHQHNLPLEALANTPIDVVSESEDLERYKSNKALQFLSGSVSQSEDGSFIRRGENILYRDLIIIDIEDTGLTSQDVQNIIQEKLASYKYYLYSTISHEPNNPRLRLALEPSREMVKDEYSATIQHVMALIGINYDPKSYTWSQPQGLPIAVRGKENVSIKHLEGKPYPVQNAPTKIKFNRININNKVEITDNEFLEVFKKYIFVYGNKLYTGDKYEDYNNCLALLFSLTKAFCEDVISKEILFSCSEIIAKDNEKWISGNKKIVENLIKGFENDNNYFSQTWDIFSKMKYTKDKELIFLINKYIKRGIKSNDELMWRLSILGDQWRKQNTKVGNNDNQIVPVIPFNEISKILRDNLYFRLYGTSESKAEIYVYDYDTGIYKEGENFINKCISTIEDRYDALKYKRVHNRIKADLELSYVDRTPYLKAVENGIFNEYTKQLEAFHPKYFFVSKIATKYNMDAIENYEPIKNEYFDFDEWLNSIACYDSELVTLLWQVINEALNPNATRRKAVILLGNGLNGKGTFQEMLRNLIGTHNVSGLKVHQFQGKNDQFSLEALEHAICNIGDDVGLKPLDEIDVIKSIISGDRITFNRKGKSYMDYTFKLLLIFSANDLPPIKEKTEATLDRLLIVPFNANFKGEEDKSIREEKLKNEIIREYILYKSLHLDFDKFIEPKAVKNELEKYKIENDSVHAYLLEYIANGYHLLPVIPTSLVKNDYELFCKENDYEIEKQRIVKKIADQLTTSKLTGDRKYTKNKVHINNEISSELLSKGFPVQNKTVDCIVMIEK